MRLRTSLTAAIAAAALSTLTAPGLAAPAAAAVAPPVIVSPTAGSPVEPGFAGPVIIDYPTPGHYETVVTCRTNGEVTYRSYPRSGDYSGRTSIDIEPIVGPGGTELNGAACTIRTYNFYPAEVASAESTFTVVAPPLTLSDITVDHPTFYPLVDDGYLDDTLMTFDVNRAVDLSMTVTGAQGNLVYQDVGRVPAPGPLEAYWDGGTTSGKPVLPGNYRVTFSATAADGVTLTKSTVLTVATKMTTRQLTIDKAGKNSRRSTSGNCTSYRSGTAGRLDCQGGKFAAATYVFKIPTNAKKLRWSISTSPTEDDFCCRGTITKSADRVSKTKFQVRVEVTGYRAAVITRARLTYKARVRI